MTKGNCWGSVMILGFTIILLMVITVSISRQREKYHTQVCEFQAAQTNDTLSVIRNDRYCLDVLEAK